MFSSQGQRGQVGPKQFGDASVPSSKSWTYSESTMSRASRAEMSVGPALSLRLRLDPCHTLKYPNRCLFRVEIVAPC